MTSENDNKQVQCEICNKSAHSLYNHIKNHHKMDSAEYREKFPKALLMSCETVKNIRAPDTVIEIEYIDCKVCGKRDTSLYNHIKDHSMTTKEYRTMFPGSSLLLSEEVLKVYGTTAKRVVSKETREKIAAAARRVRTGQKHSKETIIKMQDNWDKRKEENSEEYQAYLSAISEAAKTPERLKSLRDTNAANIKSKNHNGKSSDTRLEKDMKKFLDARSLEYETQYILATDIGAFTFDFYIPTMNLLVETDGEYWHTDAMVVNRDMLKEGLARHQGFNVVRISDKNWRPKDIFLSGPEQTEISEKLFKKRLDEVDYEAKMQLPENIDQWLKMKAEKAAAPKKSRKGIPKSEEHKKNISIARTGMKLSPETCEKQRLTRERNKNKDKND